MDERVIGKCYSMCSLKEIKFREKEGLLHRFEIDVKSSKNGKRPKADIAKIVKCFERSAAGKEMAGSNELRPGPVLLMTLRYLFTEVIVRKDCNWIVVYDFIFDRLRAVRQDLTIQRLDVINCICIYEKIVRFHIYSDQRLCERSMNEYDPKINFQHLMECMEQLIILYDELDAGGVVQDLDVSAGTEAIVYNYDRTQMESLYILLRLGQEESLFRALNLPESIRNSSEVKLATKISFAWYQKNYVATTRLLQKLSPLSKCAVFCNLRIIRRETLRVMSSAYSIKTLTFPSEKLKQILLYQSMDQIKADCALFNQKFRDGQICFLKSDFNDSVKMAKPEMIFSETELDSFLPSIILE